ncbi:hypothetical protein [Actinomadura gamaensis]|uniref:Uncharacterized protein n=1 Tax=Actinomadura gamaensis TaxID=1763541 RepID=A0ABV9UCX5_9ACTN
MANGWALESPALLKAGVFRFEYPNLVAMAIIRCDARAGTYPVDVAPDADHRTTPVHWANINVRETGDAERRTCADQVKKIPPFPREENWPPTSPWPQSEWDVRTFRPGSVVTVTDSDDEGFTGRIEVRSKGFVNAATLHGAKATAIGKVKIRPDAKPGLYEVYRRRRGEKTSDDGLWARYRVGEPRQANSAPPVQLKPTATASSLSSSERKGTGLFPFSTIYWAIPALIVLTFGVWSFRRWLRRKGSA